MQGAAVGAALGASIGEAQTRKSFLPTAPCCNSACTAALLPANCSTSTAVATCCFGHRFIIAAWCSAGAVYGTWDAFASRVSLQCTAVLLVHLKCAASPCSPVCPHAICRTGPYWHNLGANGKSQDPCCWWRRYLESTSSGISAMPPSAPQAYALDLSGQ